MIAFIGSVFSPYYAAARRRGPANPADFCSLNLALYGDVKRWAMTERGRHDISRAAQHFQIGPSSVSWDGHAFTAEINEFCMPPHQRLRGRLRVATPTVINHEVLLNPQGVHRWRPFVPHARVTVELEKPSLSWQGHGYFDSNCGDAPLESGFSTWHWSRTTQGQDTLVIYDAQRRDGTSLAFARRFSPDGTIRDAALPPETQLKRGLWGVPRPLRADPGATPRLVRRLEDAPFYTRSEISTVIGGESLHGVHESLDLDRFSRRWVQTLLPFRMPRIARKRPA